VSQTQLPVDKMAYRLKANNGPCHVSGIFLPLRVKSLPLATIYEVKIPLRKWKKSLLQRNPAQMTSANIRALFGKAKVCVYLGFPHDYYSIWFNLIAAFFKSEKTTGVIKLKTHYFISNHFMKC
jgi:hypothetical protein